MKYNKQYHIKLFVVNLITSIRLLGAFVLPFIYYCKGPVIVSICVLLIFSTDAIDGKLARHWKVETFFGSLLDSLCDKLFSIVSLSILSYIRVIMIVPLLLELAIMAVNTIAYKDNKNIQSSKLGKRKTILLALTIAFSFALLASPLYIDLLPITLQGIFVTYDSITLYVLAGMIIGMQLLVLTDYSKKAFNKEYIKTLKKKKIISFDKLKMYLFDHEFYVTHKDKPLREIFYE